MNFAPIRSWVGRPRVEWVSENGNGLYENSDERNVFDPTAMEQREDLNINYLLKMVINTLEFSLILFSVS